MFFSDLKFIPIGYFFRSNFKKRIDKLLFLGKNPKVFLLILDKNPKMFLLILGKNPKVFWCER